MTARIHNVLFLCVGNSARSIIAESALRKLGAGRFRSFSAGSRPTGRVNPHAIAWLQSQDLPTDHLRSKSWDEFAQPGASLIDCVITVCGDEHGEACPAWPGHPLSAHWGVADPAGVQGSDANVREAFDAAGKTLVHRIGLLVGLPLERLDREALQFHLREIGQAEPAT
jgi:arsenate reductase